MRATTFYIYVYATVLPIFLCVTFYALYESNCGKKSKMSEDMTSETFANGSVTDL